MRLLFVWLVSLLAVGHADAATVSARTWTSEQGLPVDGVNAVLQDRAGYIWVATFDGLLRFDGARFSSVEPPPGRHWPSPRLIGLHEAGDGALWIQTEDGQLVRRASDGAFAAFPLGIPLGCRIVEDRTGALWVVGKDGLLRYDGAAFVRVLPEVFDADPPVDVAAVGDAVVVVSRDAVRRLRDGRVVETAPPALGEDAMLALVDGDAAWVAGYHGLAPIGGAALREGVAAWDVRARSVARDADGTLLVGTPDGLFRWRDGHADRILAEDADRTPRRFRQVDGAGHTWLATAAAVLRDGEVVYRSAARITDLLVDREGNGWIATLDGGLTELEPARIDGIGAPEGLDSENVYAVAPAVDGGLWVGTTGGSLHHVGRDGAVTRLGHAEGLTGDALAMLDEPGALWVGTFHGGLLRGGAAGLAPVAGVPGDATVRALLRGRTGDLLAATDQGLWRLRDDGWTRLDATLGLPSAPIRALAEGDDGTLWAATNGAGLLRIRGDVTTVLGASSIVGSDRVRGLLPDATGGVWAATEDVGLRHVPADLGDAPEVGLGPDDGLPARGVHALVDDGHGWAWGSTNRGIFRVRSETLAALARGEHPPVDVGVFDERDGMRDHEANGGTGDAVALLTDGRIAFATQAGVALVDPASVAAGEVPPPAVIESVAGHPVGAGPIVLAPEERSFSVAYTAPTFRSSDRARFRYRLDGLGEPVDAGERRTAYYTGVPPGTYTFRLRAIGADGVPSAEEATVAIVVEPYLTETLGFRALFGVLAVGLVAGGVQWRLAVLQRRQAALAALVRERTADLEAEKAALVASRQVVEQQAARLREVDQLKTRYFANLSHELRTPLTLILGPLEDVRTGRRGAVGAEAVAEVERAERNARRLFGLVNQLLDVVKIDAGKLELSRSIHDLAAIVASAGADFAPLAERRGVRLEQEVEPAPVPVDLDRRELPKVVGNLLSNAIKFTPPGGRVSVSVTRADGEAVVTVADTGPGISADGLARLFDRFYVVPGTEAALQPGTGLGLALARELTELHGGRLEVESRVGEGTTFRVRLPIAAGPVRQEVPAVPVDPGLRDAPAEPPDTDGDDRTAVLVVDDEADIRAWIARQLVDRYRVIEAADGLSALALARHEQPDLVITDLMMPGMDGGDLVRALRADPDLDWVPVIVLTARSSAESQVEGLARGADVYLTKPFSSAVLRAQVDGLVAQRQRLRERFAEGPATTAAPEEALSADDRYVSNLRAAIERRHADPAFSVQDLADEIHQDRAHLYRRCKALTGSAPSDLIRTIRLERAARLLARRTASVGEIAYACGFNSVSYFSTSFRAHFGVTPSQYAERPAT